MKKPGHRGDGGGDWVTSMATSHIRARWHPSQGCLLRLGHASWSGRWHPSQGQVTLHHPRICSLFPTCYYPPPENRALQFRLDKRQAAQPHRSEPIRLTGSLTILKVFRRCNCATRGGTAPSFRSPYMYLVVGLRLYSAVLDAWLH